MGKLDDPNSCEKGLNGYFVKGNEKMEIKISKGAECIDVINVQKFIDLSKEYKQRNFPHTDKVLQFHPLHMLSHSPTKHLAELIVDVLEKRSGFRAVISQLNFNKYFQWLRSEEDLWIINHSYHNRLLIFDEESTSILNV